MPGTAQYVGHHLPIRQVVLTAHQINVEGGHFLTEDVSLFDAPFFNMTGDEVAVGTSGTIAVDHITCSRSSFRPWTRNSDYFSKLPTKDWRMV